MTTDHFRLCSTCRTPIPYRTRYYACSVSTCNRKRLGLFFCSVECWDAHVPVARHREASAIEKTSPEQAPVEQPRRRVAVSTGGVQVSADPARRRVVSAGMSRKSKAPKEVLIVASRLKKYVDEVGEMNTSNAVMNALSEHVRAICDAAIVVAEESGRKTVMDRDVNEAIANFNLD